MKRFLVALITAMIPLVMGSGAADAQRRGGVVVYRGGGGAAFRAGNFVRGPAVYRAPLVRTAWVGGPRFAYGARIYPNYVRYGAIGAYPFYRSYGGGCWQWRLVPTAFGLQWRMINMCFAPARFVMPSPRVYRTGYPLAHPGFYPRFYRPF